MRKRSKSLFPIVFVLTGLLIYIVLAVRGQVPDARWQFRPSEAKDIRPDLPEGFEGLSFMKGGVSAMELDAVFFRLTEDDKTGIQYGYVPAEMRGPLQVLLHEGESLVIEADGASAAYSSGDLLPVFEEDAHYSFTILDAQGESLGTEDVVFLYTENVPSMYIDTTSGSMKKVDKDKHHETSAEAVYRIYQLDGARDAGGKCTIKGRGNSTWSQKKRPYNLKLQEDNILLGMDSCRKYALIANFWYSTQTRQYYAFRTAARLGLACTPQTAFVNLYIDGKYRSLYLLTQRLNVNGGTVKITDLDKANEEANEEAIRIAQDRAARADAAQRLAAAAGAEADAEGEAAGTGAAQDLTAAAKADADTADEKKEAADTADGKKEAADADTADGKKEAADADTAASGDHADEKTQEEYLPETVVMDTDEDGHEALAFAWEKEPENLTGGYLLEFENRYTKEDFWFQTETEHIAFKSPQNPSRGEYEYISGYVREAEKALFADDWTNPDTGLGCFDYFDMDSWARMYLIQDFFVQSDDEYYSFFFYKEADDPLLYCGPVWDFDLCLGNMNCGDYYKTSAQTLWLKDGRKKWLHRLVQHPDFAQLVAKLYLEELDPIVRDLLKNEYDQTVDLLETDTKINYLRWHKDLDYQERTGLVRTLLESRAQFMREYYSDPDSFHRLLFHFAWDDFSYYVKDGESMGFLPTWDYGEKQSTPQREANGFITGWQNTQTYELLQPDTPIYEDMDFDPVYIP